MDLHRAEMRRDELRRIVQSGTALYGGKIAHLYHEGLTDMKPILNRGIGKGLRGRALLGAAKHQNEAL